MMIGAVVVLLANASGAAAQTQSSSSSSDSGVTVTIYPVLAWVPTSIDIDVDLPPLDGGGGGGGGEIIDSTLDGAFLGGFAVSGGRWRVDGDGLWAGFGGDRPDLPVLKVDVDAIYFHVTGGVRVVKDLYLTTGVRRLALKYNVKLGDRPEFERKPGVWDPLIGVGWHRAGRKLEVHATFEGGGFGVGTDVELGGTFRLDWKPVTHFGLTGGYNYLYFKLSDEVRSRTFTAKQTLHGPVVGFGLYF